MKKMKKVKKKKNEKNEKIKRRNKMKEMKIIEESSKFDFGAIKMIGETRGSIFESGKASRFEKEEF